MNLAIQPLLAVTCVELLFGACAIVAFIVWMAIQAAKAAPNTPPGVPPPPNPSSRKPQPGGLQKEIDVFLRQVTPKANAQPATESGTSQTDPRRPANQPARGSQPALGGQRGGGKKGEAASPRSRLSKPGAELATRKGPGRENLGEEVSQNVSRHLDSHRLGERVQDDLQNRVQQSVDAHLGVSSGNMVGATPASIATTASDATATETALINAREFRRLLKQPEQIRQAILLNEILSRPVALRKSPDAR